jgi:hypothetical protein
MRTQFALSLAAVLLVASPVLAHHISGTADCDRDLDNTIDAGDTPVSGIDVQITSLDAQPGSTFEQATDASGAYNIGLPTRTDRYLVELLNLPAGFTIVIPGGGTYTVQIITGNSNTRRDDPRYEGHADAPHRPALLLDPGHHLRDEHLQVAPGARVGPLPPGTYGKLKVLNGGTLRLQAGTFTFCDVKLGRSAALTTQGPAIINVAGDVVIGTASRLGPAAGTAPVSVHVGGKLVRVSSSCPPFPRRRVVIADLRGQTCAGARILTFRLLRHEVRRYVA